MLIAALKASSEFVEDVARRKYQFQQVWDRMKPPSGFRKRLVLFGGVSSSLCNADAAVKYAEWLAINSNAQLYICYEGAA